jgi:uncharacterized protein (UPF0335 family)
LLRVERAERGRGASATSSLLCKALIAWAVRGGSAYGPAEVADCPGVETQSERRALSDHFIGSGDRIRSFVERIEQLDTELQELNEAKEVFAEAKGEGFDVKVLKEIIKLRKQDKDERDEHETLLDVYMRAMESPKPAPIAEAA